MNSRDDLLLRVVIRAGLLTFLASWMAGCSSIPTTTAERDATFAPYRSRSISGVPMEDFLAKRTAIVIAGSELADPEQTTDSTGQGVTFHPTHKFSTGSAAMVDSRGYLLTAAHVAIDKPITVLFHDGSVVRHYPARRVWNGYDASGKPDLALLRIDARLPAAFTWAERYQTKETALAAGLNYSENPDQPGFIMGFSAGKLLSAPTPSTSGQETTQKITSDLPLHPGDSGGPLVNTQGQLIAINVRLNLSWLANLGILQKVGCRARRPDVGWLRS